LSGVTPLDLDIIKLAAQYTAVNGREFLACLAQREQRNPQFDFLKPTHLLFSYFTSLVDSYGKVLRPSEELKERFITKSNRMKSLEIAVQRWEWTRAEEEKKRRENDEADADRLAAVDWSEFAVVEIIDFPETELLETVGMLSLNENSNTLKFTFPFLDLYLPGLKTLIQGDMPALIGTEVDDYVRKNPFNSFGVEDKVHGYIWHIDKFGNCISNINKALFDRVAKGQAFLIDIKGQQATSMITHYDEKSGGGMLVFFNFLGLLEFAISNGSATQLLGLNRNDKVIIRFGNAI
jgi:hypothetical protein